MWQASFVGQRPYKENVGLFVEGGLLVLPNESFEINRATLGCLDMSVEDGKLFVYFRGLYRQVLAIVHTHPDVYALREPSPFTDYPYSTLGLHNYIMGHLDLFDAFRTESGQKHYVRLGARNEYWRIPESKKSGQTTAAVTN